MGYKRKTKDEWQIFQNCGYGWDWIGSECSYKSCVETLRIYRENEKGSSFVARLKRIPLGLTNYEENLYCMNMKP